MLEKLKKFKWGYILIALLIAAAGVCFIAFRETLSTIALVMGIILMAFGVVFAVVTLADKKRSVGFAFKIAFSVIALSCGIITVVVHKSDAVEWLVALFGLLLIIDGSFKLQTSAMSKRYRSVVWWLMLIPAVLVIIGGFFSIRFRVTATAESEQLEQQAMISALLGVTMIIDAVANLLSAFFVSSYESRMKKEAIKEYADSIKADETKAEPAEDAEAERVDGDAEALPEGEQTQDDTAEGEQTRDGEDIPAESGSEADGNTPDAQTPEYTEGESAEQVGSAENTPEATESAPETEAPATNTDAEEKSRKPEKKPRREKKEKKKSK